MFDLLSLGGGDFGVSQIGDAPCTDFGVFYFFPFDKSLLFFFFFLNLFFQFPVLEFLLNAGNIFAVDGSEFEFIFGEFPFYLFVPFYFFSLSFHLELGSTYQVVQDSAICIHQFVNYLRKPVKVNSLAIDGVHFEVLGNDVFGNYWGEFKEMAEKHKLLQVHEGQLMLEIVKGSVLV